MQWDLTISTKKIKVLIVGKDAAEQSPNAVITIRGEVLEVVSRFKYLNSMFTSDGMLDTEFAHRVANASSAFAMLHQAKVWSSKALSLSTKLQFLQTTVMTVLLYGGDETWSLLDKHLDQLSVFHMRCSRQICGISLLNHIANPVILNGVKLSLLTLSLKARGLRGLVISAGCLTADCPNQAKTVAADLGLSATMSFCLTFTS